MKPCFINNSKNVESELNNNTVNDYHNSEIKTIYNVDNILRGDLSAIGGLWIGALKAALVGGNFSIIPVVEAAKPPDTPTRPPPMRYKDLPIYGCPHFEYKDYTDEKSKCPDRNVKILHRSLLPYVKCWRKCAEKSLCEAKCFLIDTYHVNCADIACAKNAIKRSMRDPNNLTTRHATVAFGAAVGFLIGSSGGIPRKIFFTSLGLLSTGSLCFPKETDIIFKEVVYNLGKVFIAAYNRWCGKEFVLRDRLTCRKDLPGEPPPRKPIKCPPNK